MLSLHESRRFLSHSSQPASNNNALQCNHNYFSGFAIVWNFLILMVTALLHQGSAYTALLRCQQRAELESLLFMSSSIWKTNCRLHSIASSFGTQSHRQLDTMGSVVYITTLLVIIISLPCYNLTLDFNFRLSDQTCVAKMTSFAVSAAFCCLQTS